MKRSEIEELGYIWDDIEQMYKILIKEDGGERWEWFTKREIEMAEEKFELKLAEDFSMESPFKYRYLVGLKPMHIWYLVKYLTKESKRNPDILDFLEDGCDYLALLNNEFTKEEFIESVNKLEKYGLIEVEWIDKEDGLCSLSIENPPPLKKQNLTNSKKRMKKCFNIHEQFENLPARDFIP
jgi:hypothetical protein